MTTGTNKMHSSKYSESHIFSHIRYSNIQYTCVRACVSELVSACVSFFVCVCMCVCEYWNIVIGHQIAINT